MDSDLKKIFIAFSEDFKGMIEDDSRHYIEVSIARKATELGLGEVEALYRDAYAIVPLKHPLKGMKVRIDGRTFVNYAQFDSGIVVPPYIAQQAGMPHQAYDVWDSMICNFA